MLRPIKIKVYFIENTETGRIKVGFTTSSVNARMTQLQTGSDSKLRLLGVITSDKKRGTTEKQLHLLLTEWHYRGEWFTKDALPQVIKIIWSSKNNAK
jgi:hypothetical protein